MVQRTLSKSQGRVFVALATQKADLQRAYQEIIEAEREQVEMLREKYGLPEGEYQVRQEGENLVMFMTKHEADEADKAAEMT